MPRILEERQKGQYRRTDSEGVVKEGKMIALKNKWNVTHITSLRVQPEITEAWYDEKTDTVHCHPKEEREWMVRLNALVIDHQYKSGNTGTLADAKYLSELEWYQEYDGEESCFEFECCNNG